MFHLVALPLAYGGSTNFDIPIPRRAATGRDGVSWKSKEHVRGENENGAPTTGVRILAASAPFILEAER